MPADPCLTRGGPNQRGKHMNGARLAGTIRPEQPEELAARNGKIQPVHGERIAIALGELFRPDGEFGHCDERLSELRRSRKTMGFSCTCGCCARATASVTR